ncbi:hypothetical protein HDV03_001873 [Kappamyces sp. JEL0829]|nr:hypothetical protein HDV03_001873 [Kappamyces sp. JEL0829]
MDNLYKKAALPGFDDNRDEHTIDDLTDELTRLFQKSQHKIKELSRMGVSDQSEKMSKNIQTSLASRLQEMTTSFRKSQSKYLKKLRKQETQGAAVNFQGDDRDDEDLDAVFADAEMAVVQENDHAITQREKDINEIAKSIMTMAEIFRELQTMVIDQGTVLDRIDYNIEQTNVNLENAHEQLQKAAAYQSNRGAKICIAVLAIMVFIMFIFLPFGSSSASLSAVSPFTNIEARWSKLPLAEQGALADRLGELQKGDWKDMSMEEKRAAYYIAYGGYGPRTPRDPTLQYRVFGWVAGFIGLAYVLWLQSDKLLPKLVTRTPEWKAAEAQLMIEQKMNPHSGPYAEWRKKNEN